MNKMVQGLWTITALSSAFGGLLLFYSYSDNSADVVAAYAARAVAFAVIPYCLTRAVSEISKKDS